MSAGVPAVVNGAHPVRVAYTPAHPTPGPPAREPDPHA